MARPAAAVRCAAAAGASSLLPFALAALAAGVPAAEAAGGIPRAQQLYENHCTGCHESGVHIRARHKARSVADIEAWVRRWQRSLDLDWSDEDISDVTRYLNDRHYHYGPAGKAEG